MTDEGERLYGEARRIVEEVAEVESRLRGAGEAARYVTRGRARRPCPGSSWVLPLSGRFARRYPGLGLEFSVSDRFVDLVEDGIDVAIRIGEVGDTDLHARRIGTARRICVAAPALPETARDAEDTGRSPRPPVHRLHAARDRIQLAVHWNAGEGVRAGSRKLSRSDRRHGARRPGDCHGALLAVSGSRGRADVCARFFKGLAVA